MLVSRSQLLDINLRFFSRAGHTYKNGMHPIVLRITYRSQRRDILTGLSCLKDNWSSQSQQVKPGHQSSSPTNKELTNVFQKVKEHFHELKYSGMDFSIDELISRIRGKETPPQTLMEYTDLKIQELQDRIGIDMTKTTFYKYKRIARYMNDFLNFRRGVKNIAVGNIPCTNSCGFSA